MGLAPSSEGLKFDYITNVVKVPLVIHKKAAVLRILDISKTWNTFLSSPCTSFAASQNEIKTILLNCFGDQKSEIGGVKDDIKDPNSENVLEYISMIADLHEISENLFDFMSILSSILFLTTKLSIEEKIDILFDWISVNGDDLISFDEFYLAIVSFEEGLANLLGIKKSKEDYLKGVASQWFSLCSQTTGPRQSLTTLSLSTKGITKDQFFELCTNRQYPIRRFLEVLSTVSINDEIQEDHSEIVASVSSLSRVALEENEIGDQWLANPAWKHTAAQMTPASASRDGSKPSAALSLDWVHGYRGYDCRNNIIHLDNNSFLTFAAGLCVLQTSGTSSTQRYFGEHTDDVISLAVHIPETQTPQRGVLIASGEIGRTPTVHLWLSDSLHSIACMKGYHKKGVCQLSFSRDGSQLLTVGVDYSVAIYDTQVGGTNIGKLIGSTNGPKDKIYHSCSFHYGPNSSGFVTCGERHLLFWSSTKTGVVKSDSAKGLNKKTVFMCLASCSDTVIAGDSDGNLVRFKNGELFGKNPMSAHEKSVNAVAILQLSDGSQARILVFTGGKEGKIKVWSEDLTLQSEFSLVDPNPSRAVSPRAISISPDKSHLIVGTQSCSVLQYDLSVNRDKVSIIGGSVCLLNQGHFKDELWGLAVKPSMKRVGHSKISGNSETNLQYCTVGDDGFLRIWGLHHRAQIACKDMGAMARACAYHPTEDIIAVGFGGRVGKGKQKYDGMFRAYRVQDEARSSGASLPRYSIEQIYEAHESKQWISDIKFSPDGNLLAVGSHDGNIYIYSYTKQFQRKTKFSKHNAAITHFDFSKDSNFIRSNCAAYELLFSDARTGQQVSSTEMKSKSWATLSCPLSWEAQGIWPTEGDGTDINCIGRSHSKTLLAIGDDFGKIKCFRCPSVARRSMSQEYSGHSAHIMNVGWICSNPSGSLGQEGDPGLFEEYLISVGGDDKCIFQWRCEDREAAAYEGAASSRSRTESTGLNLQEEEIISSEELLAKAVDEADIGGDEFMAVKPWLGAIRAPSAWASTGTPSSDYVPLLATFSDAHNGLQKMEITDRVAELRSLSLLAENILDSISHSGVSSKSPPDIDELELEWVHGYRGFDSRNNLKYVTYGEGNRAIVYPAACLGVLYDISANSQRYFRGHTDDILCLDVCNTANKSIVATGQNGKAPTFVWEVPSLTVLATITTGIKSVSMISFSGDDGRLLITIGQDNQVVVSDWRNQRVVASVKGEAAPTYHVIGSKRDANHFLSCGDKFIRLWTLSGRNLTSSKVPLTAAIPGSKEKPVLQNFLSAAECDGVWIVGCEDGSIYGIQGGSILGRTSLVSAQKMDKKESAKNGISSISVSEPNLLLTGSRNGTIAIWSLTKEGKQIKINLIRRLSLNHQTSPPDEGASTAVATSLQLLSPQIQAISCNVVSSTESFIAIGSRGCEAFELSLSSLTAPNGVCRVTRDEVFTRGHFQDELWGLAVHPTRPQYCTVGDDRTLRQWDVFSHTSVGSAVPLGAMARACAYHPTEDIIAVGFGGRVGRGKQKDDGMIRVYAGLPLVKVEERNDAKKWVSDIKFSPDGSVLVSGGHDDILYIYKVTITRSDQRVHVKLDLKSKFSKHNSYITHFDFSADGIYLQSNCGAYELLFSEVSSGRQITSATELRDVKWKSWTCTLGWPVQGIWPEGGDGTDINSVDRSHTGHLLATADDFGKVKIFRYPCDSVGARYLEYGGHSSHVMNARWCPADSHLITVGGNDKCIFQWKHVMLGGNGNTSSSGQSDGSFGSTRAVSRREEEDFEESEAVLAGALGEADIGGDEFMAVKPWLGAIRAPSRPPTVNPSAPSAELRLKWVHGYSETRGSNLFYTVEANVVYPAAALGVKLCKEPDASGGLTQTYFRGHDDDVTALTISHDRQRVASGQTASHTSKGKGSIYIWDSVDCRLLSSMKGCHQRSIVSLAFSPSGEFLLSVGGDDNYTHTLWKDLGGGWSRVQQVASEKSDMNAIIFSAWASPSSDFILASGGSKSIHFWSLNGAKLTKKQGRVGKFKQQPLLCAANLQDKGEHILVVGTSSGDIYKFNDRECYAVHEKAHDGALLCFREVRSDSDPQGEIIYLLSGGKDKFLRIWTPALVLISSFDASNVPFSSNPCVSSLDYRFDGNDIVMLVGLYGGEIVEVKATDPSNKGINNANIFSSQPTILLQSHSVGELWGLATHPLNHDIVATAGDDSTIKIWNITRNRLVTSKKVGWAVRAVAWSPDGDYLAIGLYESEKFGGGGKKFSKAKAKAKGKGKVDQTGSDTSRAGACQIYKMITTNNTVTFDEGLPPIIICDSVSSVSDLKFSPRGRFLSIGTHDSCLYTFEIDESMSTNNPMKFSKHSSAVRHLDFSEDEAWLQSTCQAYELLFSNPLTAKQETSATKLADTSWATWTCPLGWPVQGIWPPGADGSDINSVDRSHSKALLATADDFGKVKLFRYPCVTENSKYKEFVGHSSHVTNVRWTANDRHLISVGGNDNCVFIWDVLED